MGDDSQGTRAATLLRSRVSLWREGSRRPEDDLPPPATHRKSQRAPVVQALEIWGALPFSTAVRPELSRQTRELGQRPGSGTLGGARVVGSVSAAVGSNASVCMTLRAARPRRPPRALAVEITPIGGSRAGARRARLPLAASTPRSLPRNERRRTARRTGLPEKSSPLTVRRALRPPQWRPPARDQVSSEAPRCTRVVGLALALPQTGDHSRCIEVGRAVCSKRLALRSSCRPGCECAAVGSVVGSAADHEGGAAVCGGASLPGRATEISYSVGTPAPSFPPGATLVTSQPWAMIWPSRGRK